MKTIKELELEIRYLNQVDGRDGDCHEVYQKIQALKETRDRMQAVYDALSMALQYVSIEGCSSESLKVLLALKEIGGDPEDGHWLKKEIHDSSIRAQEDKEWFISQYGDKA